MEIRYGIHVLRSENSDARWKKEMVDDDEICLIYPNGE